MDNSLKKRKNFLTSVPFLLGIFLLIVAFVILSLYVGNKYENICSTYMCKLKAFFGYNNTKNILPYNSSAENTKETFIPEVKNIFMSSAILPGNISMNRQDTQPGQEMSLTQESSSTQESSLTQEMKPTMEQSNKTERKTCHVIKNDEDEYANIKQDNTFSLNDPNTGAPLIGPGYANVESYRAANDLKYADSSNMNIVPSTYYYLNDGDNTGMDVSFNMCSKSCCSPQWQPPFNTDDANSKFINANKDLFIPNNMYCYDGYNNSGCLCMSKEQGKFIYNRGGNGREWF